MTLEQVKQGESRGEAVFRRAVGAQAAIYVVLDAARQPDGPEQFQHSDARSESLFAGELGGKLKEVAPYLVEFRARSAFARWWFEQWGHSVGIMAEAPVRLEELRQHFRTLLIVRDEQRRKFYFRFYDPRVLREFVPKCTAEEVKRFFGPIAAIYCEGQGGEELLTFRPDQRGVSIKHSPVPPQGHGIVGNR